MRINLLRSQLQKHVEVSTSIAEINRIVRTRPTELKYLFKSPTEDKGRLTRLISQLVPYRVGIEFETFGAVGEYLFPKESTKKYNNRNAWIHDAKRDKEINKLICKKLKLVDFREDSHVDPSINHVCREEERDMNEVRISISGHKQLITLWNTLQTLSKCLVIPKENGGIHIHIDAPFVRESRGSEFALKWFDRPAILSEVLQIFEGYSGTYNKRHASKSKANYIRITDYPTIEFRIGRLSYDYPTLIRYIIKCSELVRRCKHDAVLNSRIQSKGTNRNKVGISTNSNTYTTPLDPNRGLPDEEDASASYLRNELRVTREYISQLEDQLFRVQYLDAGTSSRWTRYNAYDSSF